MSLSKFIVAILAISSTYANAAAVHSCGDLNRIDNLIGNLKSFANGDVKVAYVTTEEPAAAPDHILVFVDNSEMSSECFAISENAQGRGFASLNIDKIKAKVDSAGLHLSLPVRVFTGDDTKNQIVKFVVNRAVRNKPIVTIEK